MLLTFLILSSISFKEVIFVSNSECISSVLFNEEVSNIFSTRLIRSSICVEIDDNSPVKLSLVFIFQVLHVFQITQLLANLNIHSALGLKAR